MGCRSGRGMSENPGRTKPKRKWRRVLLALAIVLVLVVAIILPGASILVYEDTFGKRYNTPGWMRYALADFPGLRMKRCVFWSKDGKKLAGYQYSRNNLNQSRGKAEGLVVIAHGFGGGGQNTYMDVASYFTSQGFLVFAYDATGNDESAGKSVRGLPQGVEDLDQALRFVEGEHHIKIFPFSCSDKAGEAMPSALFSTFTERSRLQLWFLDSIVLSI